MFVLTIGLDQYSLPEFNNINTSCGDWKTHVLVWESVVTRGWYFNSPNVSQEFGVCFCPNALWDADPHLSRIHLWKFQMGLAFWGPCVKYGFRFFGWYEFMQFGDYRLTFWAWFSTLHQSCGKTHKSEDLQRFTSYEEETTPLGDVVRGGISAGIGV